MSVHRITRSAEIDAPKDRTFAVLDDIGSISCWGPPVGHSEAVGDTVGVGAERRCVFDGPGGSRWVRERLIVREPAEGLHVIEMIDGPARPPFERVRGRSVVTMLGPDRSKVVLSFELTTRGPLQWLLAVITRPMLGRAAGQLVRGLADHLAPREPAGTGGQG
ncbi:MAG: SRPBCC family protein [Actinomycetota bacterium]